MLHILKCSRKVAEVHTCTRLLHIMHTYWLGFTLERESIYFFTPVLLEKVYVVCDSYEVFFVYIISFEDPLKKKRKKKEKKEKRKERIKKEEKGLIVVLHCFRWCVVTSFVSRLAPLARSRLGPAQYRR